MTDAAVASEMGTRVAAWLRQAYPRDGAKLVAREFNASPHTTRRWFEGSLPKNRHMAAMARKWGHRFVAFVYEPAIGPWGTVDGWAERAYDMAQVWSLGPFRLGGDAVDGDWNRVDDRRADDCCGGEDGTSAAPLAPAKIVGPRK